MELDTLVIRLVLPKNVGIAGTKKASDNLAGNPKNEKMSLVI